MTSTRLFSRWTRLGALTAALTVSLCVVAPAPGASSLNRGATFTPRHGPIGTVITVTAQIDHSDRKTLSRINYVTAYITTGHPHAGLSTVLSGRLSIARDGAMRLTVTLPRHAEWTANPMSGSTDQLSVTPAPTELELAWPCRACGLGTFQVEAATTLPFTGANEGVLLEVAALLMLAGALALAANRAPRSTAV